MQTKVTGLYGLMRTFFTENVRYFIAAHLEAEYAPPFPPPAELEAQPVYSCAAEQAERRGPRRPEKRGPRAESGRAYSMAPDVGAHVTGITSRGREEEKSEEASCDTSRGSIPRYTAHELDALPTIPTKAVSGETAAPKHQNTT